jgi:glycerophosphoryl diester phosphodiesterase
MLLQIKQFFSARKLSSNSLKRKLILGVISVIVLGILAWQILRQPLQLVNPPQILGHGGMGVNSILPLNSMASIKKALSYQIDGTEIDVRMTADEVLIALHDDQLQSTTDCEGLVSKSILNELKYCLNKTWIQSEPISQLDAILSSDFPEGTTFSLDLKTDSEDKSERSQTFIREVASTVSDYPEYKFLVESKSLWLLSQLSFHKTGATLFYYAHEPDKAIELALEHQLNGISINMNLITAEQVARAHNDSLMVMVWGTGTIWSNRTAVNLGADVVQTDGIRSMVAQLQK